MLQVGHFWKPWTFQTQRQKIRHITEKCFVLSREKKPKTITFTVPIHIGPRAALRGCDPEATRTLGRWLLGWGLFPSSLGEIPTRTLFLWSIIMSLSSLLLSKYLQISACHPWVNRNKSGELFSQLEPVVNAMNVQFLCEHHKTQDRGTPKPSQDCLEEMCWTHCASKG